MKIASHLIVSVSALASGMLLGATISRENSALFIMGSILPDIDIYWYKLNKMFFSHRTLSLSHRGWTHHLFLPMLGIVVSLYYSNLHCVYIFMGVLLHDILDMFSYSGVPYGFTYKKRIGLKVYRTGSLSEFLFLAVVVEILMGIPLVYKWLFV